MITLQELQDMWKKDAILDHTEISLESARIGTMHAKYLGFLSDAKLRFQKATNDYNKLKKMKWKYYTGKISEEELKEQGWSPFGYILKSDIEHYISGDVQLLELESKKFYYEEFINSCLLILKELNNRTWQIRTIESWNRFTQGA